MATFKQMVASYERAKAKKDSAITKLHNYFQDRSDIEIYMNEFEDDGLCVMSEDVASGVTVSDAQAIIKSHGRITEDNFGSYL